MPDRFDLERRAAELWPERDDLTHRSAALQLARELAEAIRGASPHCYCNGCQMAESFARPRSREDVYREALEKLAGCGPRGDGWPSSVAREALDEGSKVEK